MSDAALTRGLPTPVVLHPRMARRMERLAWLAGLLALALGAVVMVGWLFDVEVLRKGHPSFESMKANAALGLVLLGAAIILRHPRSERVGVARTAAGAASLIGALTLAQYVFALDLGIDELMFTDVDRATVPGRMSPVTALDLMLIGAALIFLDARGRGGAYPSEWLALSAGALAILAFLANVYGLHGTYGLGEFESIALNPALALLMSAAAVLLVRPARGVMQVVSSDGPGGTLARRLVPAAVVIPAVVGGVLEAIQHAGWLVVGEKTALFAATSVALFTGMTWWTATALLRADGARRLAEEAVRASEDNLATTLDSIGDGVIATDADGKVTRMNPVAEQLTGWRFADASGRPLVDAFHIINEDSRDTVESPVERVLREGIVVGLANHTSLIARDGTERAIADSGAPIRDANGRIRGVVLVFRDMTAERGAERALRSSQLRFERLSQSGIVGIVVAGADGAIREANAEFARMAGRGLDDLRAGKVRWADLVPGSSRPGLETLFDQARAHGRAVPTEQELTGPDGVVAPVLIGAAALDEDRTIAVVADLHERRERERAEKELRRTEDQLRRSQKLEAVGRLAGGIAHDFNNLLTVILSYGQMILRRTVEEDPRHRDLREVVRAAERAAELTRQLLAFSRQQVLQPAVIDLNEVVTRVTQMLSRVIGEDIDLALVPAEGLGKVNVDPGQIEQVLVNLVVNARDAMPRGGRLTIETADVELDERFAGSHPGIVAGPYVMLGVTDTGVGMDEQTRSHIFEPFFTTKEQGKGTGLGLATVLGIVEQSGGTVWVYSELDRGTTFKIYLPRVVAQAAPRPEPAARPPRRGTETVLLVEDEQQVRELACTVLKGHGYRVLEAANAGDALLLCEQHDGEIHLLLTDVVMPRMSGRQLAERLAEVRPTMRVLFMSGYTDDAIVRHGVLSSEVQFIGKPLTPNALLVKVRDVLDTA